ncbi:MAG TPA: hypothetical protein VFM01_15215, partial [Nakamurella sp.]|nr:hypothetical protein [Nakamurella sp.]
MRLRPATLIVVIAAAVVVVALSGLTPIPPPHPSPSPSTEVASFTCCRQADVDTVRHPGETFAIHWIRVTQRVPADRTPASYELHAALSGAYPSVSDLKASVAASS